MGKREGLLCSSLEQYHEKADQQLELDRAVGASYRTAALYRPRPVEHAQLLVMRTPATIASGDPYAVKNS